MHTEDLEDWLGEFEGHFLSSQLLVYGGEGFGLKRRRIRLSNGKQIYKSTKEILSEKNDHFGYHGNCGNQART